MRSERVRLATFVARFWLAGMVLDFVMNGLFDVRTVVIWGTAYVGAACVIGTQLLESAAWERWTRYGVISFLIGGFGGHFLLADRHTTRVYSMLLTTPLSTMPLTLHSDQWPQVLIVTSEPLRTELSRRASQSDAIPVSILVTQDYGCIKSFVVDRVAGVDVRLDHDASWVWKGDPRIAGYGRGPGMEDQRLPWCRRTGL